MGTFRQKDRRPNIPQRGMTDLNLTCTWVNCHMIGTTGVAVGPDLTHVASRETLAAGIIENTPENLAKWISDQQDIKPGSYMPDLQLSEQEVRDLVA